MLGGYGDFMYQTGMIDEQQRDYVDQQTSLGVKLIQQKKWLEAFEVNSYLIASTALVLDLFFPGSSLFDQILQIFDDVCRCQIFRQYVQNFEHLLSGFSSLTAC